MTKSKTPQGPEPQQLQTSWQKREKTVERLRKLGFEEYTDSLKDSELKTLAFWLQLDVVFPTFAVSLSTGIASLALITTSSIDPTEDFTSAYQMILAYVFAVCFVVAVVSAALVVERRTQLDRSMGLAVRELLRMAATDDPPHLVEQRRNLAPKLRKLRGAAERAFITVTPDEWQELLDSETPYASASQWARERIITHLTVGPLASEDLMKGWLARLMSTKAGKLAVAVSATPIVAVIVQSIISGL